MKHIVPLEVGEVSFVPVNVSSIQDDENNSWVTFGGSYVPSALPPHVR